jgi:glucose/arabinose dehydrogenase
VTIGSNSNAGENGIAAETDRARIWEVDSRTGSHRVFASGIRNPNGMVWAPDGKLWVTVNERDEIGGDLVPDYMTSVRDGGFYGWPYSYYGAHVDERVKDKRPDLVAKAIVPDYALGTHTASLGLLWSSKDSLGAQFSSGIFVGQHGSWNRRPLNGYRVAYVPFKDSKPAGKPADVLTGFASDEDGTAKGRPVGLAFANDGSLLVADDIGNTVWRVTR